MPSLGPVDIERELDVRRGFPLRREWIGGGGPDWSRTSGTRLRNSNRCDVGRSRRVGTRAPAFGSASPCHRFDAPDQRRFQLAMASSPRLFWSSLQYCSMTALDDVIACSGSISAARWLQV